VCSKDEKARTSIYMDELRYSGHRARFKRSTSFEKIRRPREKSQWPAKKVAIGREEDKDHILA